MAKVRGWVGLDVHARSVLAVTIDGESGELRSRRLSGMTSEAVEFRCSLPGPTRAAYELKLPLIRDAPVGIVRGGSRPPTTSLPDTLNWASPLSREIEVPVGKCRVAASDPRSSTGSVTGLENMSVHG